MIAAMGVGNKAFRALGHPFNRAADLFCRPCDERLLGIVENLRAEAATHVGRIDAQLVLGNVEHKGAHQQTNDMRVLARRIERVRAACGVIIANRHPRLDGIGDETVVDEIDFGDVGRILEGRLHSGGVAELPVVAKVVGRHVLVHSRPAARKRRLHIDDRRQFLEVEIDEFGCILGLPQALGDDGHHRVAHMAHLARRQNGVGGLLHGLAILRGHLPAAGQPTHAIVRQIV